ALVGRKIASLLIEKAKKEGIAFGIIREMKSWLRPAQIAQYVSENDMVAWVVNTGGPPMVAPPGGREPVIGTNPIGIGIPMEKLPLVIDMATSTRAWGEVRLAKKFNHKLPKNSFLDKDGVVTENVDEAYAAIPAGGYKGFSIGLLIEILGGSLVGMNMGKGDVNEAYHTRNRGATILVINPEMTVGKEEFKNKNEEFINLIKNSPPTKGSKKVTLPGDRALTTKKNNLDNGYLEIDDNLCKEIESLN
ncbi:MAG: Ldh family oxidoreductase, partial [Candidatus Paceibacterota bacterium]